MSSENNSPASTNTGSFDYAERDLYVLSLLASGSTQAQVAAQLGISRGRVSQIAMRARKQVPPSAPASPPATLDGVLASPVLPAAGFPLWVKREVLGPLTDQSGLSDAEWAVFEQYRTIVGGSVSSPKLTWLVAGKRLRRVDGDAQHTFSGKELAAMWLRWRTLGLVPAPQDTSEGKYDGRDPVSALRLIISAMASEMGYRRSGQFKQEANRERAVLVEAWDVLRHQRAMGDPFTTTLYSEVYRLITTFTQFAKDYESLQTKGTVTQPKPPMPTMHNGAQLTNIYTPKHSAEDLEAYLIESLKPNGNPIPPRDLRKDPTSEYYDQKV